MYWSMPFYKFGCSYVMLYNFQNTWCSFCLFCEYWFEIINYNMHYIHVLQMSCMWIKDGVHFKFNSGQFSGLPTELPTISILENSGLPTELPTELPTISVYGSSGQPNLHGQNSHGQHMGSPLHCPLSCPLFSYLEVVGCLLSCPLSCPLFPYMEVVGSLLCMAKFPWAAHGQPTPLPTELPTFFIFGSSGLPTELPTELPTVSIYGSSGQPNLHGKIPMGSPRAAHSVAHVCWGHKSQMFKTHKNTILILQNKY